MLFKLLAGSHTDGSVSGGKGVRYYRAKSNFNIIESDEDLAQSAPGKFERYYGDRPDYLGSEPTSVGGERPAGAAAGKKTGPMKAQDRRKRMDDIRKEYEALARQEAEEDKQKQMKRQEETQNSPEEEQIPEEEQPDQTSVEEAPAEEETQPEEETSQEQPAEGQEEDGLEQKNVPELRVLAQKHGVSGFRGMNKEDLIRTIRERQSQQ